MLLSKLNAKQHIEVELNLDELDLTAVESRAAYDEIKTYVCAGKAQFEGLQFVYLPAQEEMRSGCWTKL